MDKSSPLYVIIHGHFYQPPREDPWTGEIDRQDSAWPYHDWNQRINAECYAANADARTLNARGQIDGIVNNYRHISFNFGPTLLTWLERHDAATYRAVLDADRESLSANGGHGNAIAQVYNHVILPLANTRDKYTQVRWGLADFRKRFGRDSEGLWLSETAINQDTAEVLADCGVKFVILSPTQADAVRGAASGGAASGGREWRDVSNNSIDTARPYWIRTKKGDLAAFFYDMDISKSVGFEHLLRSAENFRNRILSARRADREPDMVNVATDGESYGHHEPFANMCLAALVRDSRGNGHYRLTNYGRFLELCPPKEEVRLKAGRHNLGTAWSCAHGIGRWMEDCGCEGGGGPGWNQRWRGPLRAAFDGLRDALADAATRACEPLLRDFWMARDDYVHVLLDDGEAAGTVTPALSAFFARHALRELSPAEKRTVRLLMESQKHAMFMYTSCGWFFSEISGLETVQCLRYAERALEYARAALPEGAFPADLEERYLRALEAAPSNLPAYGSGRRVHESLVRAQVLDAPRVVNQYLLERFLAGGDRGTCLYDYAIEVAGLDEHRKDGATAWIGTARVDDRRLLERREYLFLVIRSSHLEVESWIRPFEDPHLREYLGGLVAGAPLPELRRKVKDWFTASYSLADLKFDAKERVVHELFQHAFKELHALRSEKMPTYLELIRFYARLAIPIPEVERANLEATLNTEIGYLLQGLETGAATVEFEKVAELLGAARATNLKVNRETVEALFALKIRQRYDEYLADGGQESFDNLLRLLDFANGNGLDYQRKALENSVFALLAAEVRPVLEADIPVLEGEGLVRVRQLLRLAETINIEVWPLVTRLEEVLVVQGGPRA